jgi:hypothetical protein
MTHRYLPSSRSFDPCTNVKQITFSLRKPRILITTDPSLSETITTNDVSLNEYTNGQFDNVIADMNARLHTLWYCDINIYTDAWGTIFALGNEGKNIENRFIKTMAYTYPYIDGSENFVFGNIVLTFDDDSTFSVSDEYHTVFWYSFYGMDPMVVKQFS